MLWKNLYALWRASWKSRSRMSWLLLVGRSSRILYFPRTMAALNRLESYATYTATAIPHDMYASVSYRYYLRQGLSLTQRMEFFKKHCSFESKAFNTAYRQQVYLCGGLTLWERQIGDAHFTIKLVHSGSRAMEGDLTVILGVNQSALHRISFSWVEDAERPGSMVPFITRNQRGWGSDTDPRQRFDVAFPQNYPNFFCYVALDGLARAAGARIMLGVPAAAQVCSGPEGAHSANTYDTFWETVGGSPCSGLGFRLPLPMPSKPLEEVPSKHRKRAAARRAYWAEIADSAHATLTTHLAADNPRAGAMVVPGTTMTAPIPVPV